jgi:putative flippase GtrA
LRAIKFGAVGIANTALDVAVFSGLTLIARAPAAAANAVSYSSGIALSFALNRAWTFHDRRSAHPWRQLVLFISGSLTGLALSTLIVGTLAGAWGPLPAKAVSIIATFAWNYLFSNIVVFRR